VINDNETREKLLICAKIEFMEKGYMQSSLRNICKNAGVTTGALYFFFRDKEDLFANLVEEPLNQLLQVMNQHYADEMLTEDISELMNEEDTTDFEATRQIIICMYQNYDAYILIIQKSQGSKFENFIDRFIALTEKHYRILADRISQQMEIPKVEEYMIHWVSHMQIDSFVYMLTHEKSLEAALEYMESMTHFLISGWLTLFKKEKK
jgi:AcrR family transcriptional regulator